MDKLVKRDRAILEYLVRRYSKDQVVSFLQQLNKLQENQNKNNIKH
jgi:hypothetical protein